jgi:hypothetical protein
MLKFMSISVEGEYGSLLMAYFFKYICSFIFFMRLFHARNEM